MDRHDKVMELTARRGFIWPSYEIYGGVSGFYDYGPLGASLKKNVEDVWRKHFVVREGFLEISSPTIGPEEVFIASGHVSNFVDPMTECRDCGEAYRADHLLAAQVDIVTDGMTFDEVNAAIKDNHITCPECGGKPGEVWSYNLMFKTQIGPGQKKTGYMRPETAQAMFMAFNRLYGFYRKKLPFGAAQLGRAYRNEIAPRQGLIRLREFSQAEVEIFIDPKEKGHPKFAKVANETMMLVPNQGEEGKMTAGAAVQKGIMAHETLAYYLVITLRFLLDVGVSPERIRFRQHKRTEMAHYAADCWDAEIFTDRHGWVEVVGIADRTDYDLMAHQRVSGEDLAAFIQYDEPRVVKRRTLDPNMGRIGPVFKKDAGAVVAALKGASEDVVAEFERKGWVEIEVNGNKIGITPELAIVKDVEEKVTGEKLVPHVIEPSFGIDRIVFAVLESAFSEREEKNVMSFRTEVAPVKVAVFPLVKKEPLLWIADEIETELKEEGIMTTVDFQDTIGRRYARVDEVGVPYAITVDFEDIKGDETKNEQLVDCTVTIRDRDTTEQKRIKIGAIVETVSGLLRGKISFKDL